MGSMRSRAHRGEQGTGADRPPCWHGSEGLHGRVPSRHHASQSRPSVASADIRSTLGLAGALALSVSAVWAVPVTAADDPVTLPAAIVAGTCAAPERVFQTLSDVSTGTLPVGAADAVPAGRSITGVPMVLSDLVATPFSITVTAADGTPIACGDIGGLQASPTTLLLGLSPAGGSGAYGTAELVDEADGTTTIVLTLAQPAAVEPTVPTAESVSLAGNLYFAGWSIAITDATYDPATATLAIDGTYENHADLQASLLVIQQDGGVRLDWNGTVVEVAFADPVNVPAGGTVPATLKAIYAVPEGFSLADATLEFGQPTDQQATLALTDGATGTSFLPQPFEAKGRASMKGAASVRIDGGQVIAAGCDGNPDQVYFSTADADQLSILLDVTIQGNKNGGQFTSFVTTPDGLTSPGTPGDATPAARETAKGRFCYTVPAPVQGEYVLTFEGNGKRAKVTLTIP